jgi:hypothetical protein
LDLIEDSDNKKMEEVSRPRGILKKSKTVELGKYSFLYFYAFSEMSLLSLYHPSSLNFIYAFCYPQLKRNKMG